MNYKNSEVFVWYKINFTKVIFNQKHLHYYLKCNSLLLLILKLFNFKLIKIDFDNIVFNSKKENIFFEFDFFIYRYSFKILNYLKNNSKNNKNEILIEKIYLSFICEDIKENSLFFIRSINYLKNKFPKKKINFIFEKSEFSNIWSLLLKKKYKNINTSFNSNITKYNLIFKIFFLNLTLFFNYFRFINEKDNKPKIFQEYIGNVFDNYPNSGHLFWLAKSKIKFSDITWFSFNRKSKNNFFNPVTKKNNKIFKISKFSILNFRDMYTENFSYYLKKIFNINYKNYKFYLLKFYTRYRIEHYKKLIENHNIKIFHHYQEPHYINLALAYSCKKSDCIFIWNHWSIDQHPMYYFKYGYCDILLSWGKWNTSYMNSHNYLYDYIFVTGMIAGDKLKPSKKQQDKKNKIIVFDSTSNPKSLHHPTYLLEEFYEKLINLANEKNHQILIKPKGNIKNKNLSKQMLKRIFGLVKKGKFKLISYKLTPTEVGNSNDLYISWGQNTAGNIANIQGKNVLYFDNVELKFHPFAKKKFIIKKSRDLDIKIDNYFKKKEKFKLKLNEKNYLNQFYDGKANERASFIFDRLFQELSNGVINKEKVINLVIKEYNTKYNSKIPIAKKGKMKTPKIWETFLKKIENKYENV